MLSILMTKQGAIGAAVVLALIAGAAYLNGEIRAAEERGQAELMAEAADSSFKAVMEDSVSIWGERITALSGAYDTLAVELAQQKGATRSAREGSLQVTAAARTRIRTLADSLETLTAEDLEVIATSIDSLEIVGVLCDESLETCEALVKAADSRFWEVEAQLRQTQDVARQGNIALDRLQNMRRPKMSTAGYIGWAVAIGEAAMIVLSAITGN